MCTYQDIWLLTILKDNLKLTLIFCICDFVIPTGQHLHQQAAQERQELPADLHQLQPIRGYSKLKPK